MKQVKKETKEKLDQGIFDVQNLAKELHLTHQKIEATEAATALAIAEIIKVKAQLQAVTAKQAPAKWKKNLNYCEEMEEKNLKY